jgi:hypothetical protein
VKLYLQNILKSYETVSYTYFSLRQEQIEQVVATMREKEEEVEQGIQELR